MSLWLLVRDADGVDEAYGQASEMLTWVRQQDAGAGPGEIQGILVNAALATHPPAALSSRDSSGSEIRLHIRESTGLHGVWLLCWIENDEGGEPVDRASVIDALLGAGEENSSRLPERMVPVLSTLAGSPEKKSRPLLC